MNKEFILNMDALPPPRRVGRLDREFSMVDSAYASKCIYMIFDEEVDMLPVVESWLASLKEQAAQKQDREDDLAN